MPTFTVNPITPQWSIKEETAKTTGTTVYRVISDEATTPILAIAATSVPLRGSLYPGLTTGTLKCRSRSCAAEGQTRQHFLITCEYDSTVSLDPNPLSDAPLFDYADETSDETYFADAQSTPKKAMTTALEPFPTLPKRQTSTLVISFERNVAVSASFGTYRAMRNKINGSAVTIDGESYAEGTVLVGKLALSSVKTRDAYSYKTLSGELRVNDAGWDQKYESRGTVELKSGLQVPICGTDNAPIETTWPLNENGTKMSAQTATGFEIVLKPYVRTAIGGLFS